MPDFRQQLASRVRELRAQKGLTLKALAESSNISLRFLSSVEAGVANPSLQRLHDLADALSVSIETLLRADSSKDELHRLIEKASVRDCIRFQAWLEQNARPMAISMLGLRGAGKSTLGPILARALSLEFIKVDSLIEGEAGMTLAALFDLHGEGHVRSLEHEILLSLVDKPAVIEVAGGAVTHEPTLHLLLERTRTVWLKANSQSHWDRVVAQGDKRPMQNRQKARDELETLMQTRAPLYSRAEVIVDTEMGMASSVELIVDALNN